jgi:predicted enzyme related to lactoylglutathione lyase
MAFAQDRTETDLEGVLALVHLRVQDADRAMNFFGSLLDWDAERVFFEGHVSFYTVNTAVTVRILDDRSAPPLRPNYRVTHVDQAVEAIRSAGGTVTASEVDADGGGWAQGSDDQGVPLLVYRPGGHRASVAPSRNPLGDVGLVFIREDAARAERFYASVLGWTFTRTHPGSFYFDAVRGVGVFDEAASFDTNVTPSATLYVSVSALTPMLERVSELGGSAGRASQDMGPYYTAMCTDDQGTEFGLMAERLA